MKAARLQEFGKPLVLEEVPLPRVEDDEVLVRVHGAGVCHTDLHIAAGSYRDLPLPRVLGHEISGFAEGIGDVLVYASWGCGACPHCREGEEQLCPEAADAPASADETLRQATHDDPFARLLLARLIAATGEGDRAADALGRAWKKHEGLTD